MAKRLNDDLFEGTTMSFGEHLEELRKALFKSMFGLVIGALLGMLVAGRVVDAIQQPLKRSLEAFYANKSIDEIDARYPGTASKGLKAFMRDRKLIFEDIYIEKNLLSRFSPPNDSAKPQAQGDKAPQVSATAPAEDEIEAEPAPSKASLGQKKTADAKPDSTAAADAETSADWWSKVRKFLGHEPVDEIQTAEQTELERLFNEPLPLPDPNMVKTRIWRPLDVRITSLSAQEVFMIWVKASLIAGLVIASPYIFFQIWNFVAAGLYPHEKNYVYLYLPFSLGLFLAGAALAFFFVFDPVLQFLFQFNKSMGIDPDPRINEWLGFVLYLPLGFGVSFQLPLVMLFLNRIGIFTIEQYLAKWRIAILVIFVISMVLTPADPLSMLFMACPLTFLYFFGVVLCKWMPRGRNPFDEAYEV